MLPLSTPTNTGLAVDLLSLALVCGGLAAFAAGLADAWARLRRLAAPACGSTPGTDRHLPAVDPVTLAAYAGLGLPGLAVALMLAGVPGIPVAQAVFLALAIWGLVVTASCAPRAWRWLQSASGSQLSKAALFAAAACWSVWFWAGVFQDHVALPVALDGIAHTAWYLRIIESGAPTLGRVPLQFAPIFGSQMIGFYPTGTHALVAITSGFWGHWGLVSHAGILKAWFTLAVAAAPWGLVWVAHRLMPRMPWWIGIATVAFAMPGFRFPLEAAHEGGASRIIAHVLMMPIYADVVLGRLAGWRRQPLAAALLGMSFLMHPSAFVALCALLAYAGLCAAAAEHSWPRRVSQSAAPAVAIASGGLIVVGLLRWNHAVASPHAAAVLSLAELSHRLQRGWSTLLDPDYGMGAAKLSLIAAGVVVLVLRRKALGVPWRAVGFMTCLVVVALVALVAPMVPLPGFALIAGAYYDETPRIVEVVYEVLGFGFIVLAWHAWSVASGVGHPWHRAAWRRTAVVAALVILAATYVQASGVWVRDHIARWDRTFDTPRISRLQDLGAWIQLNTERDAVLFHPARDSEIWEAWTGRRGTFMYGECSENAERGPCVARRDLVNGRLDALRSALQEPTTTRRCLAAIDDFGRPAYFLLPGPFVSTRPFAVCSDATYMTTQSGRAILRYRGPFSPAVVRP